jgi:hypothetical protein
VQQSTPTLNDFPDTESLKYGNNVALVAMHLILQSGFAIIVSRLCMHAGDAKLTDDVIITDTGTRRGKPHIISLVFDVLFKGMECCQIGWL